MREKEIRRRLLPSVQNPNRPGREEFGTNRCLNPAVLLSVRDGEGAEVRDPCEQFPWYAAQPRNSSQASGRIRQANRLSQREKTAQPDPDVSHRAGKGVQVVTSWPRLFPTSLGARRSRENLEAEGTLRWLLPKKDADGVSRWI